MRRRPGRSLVILSVAIVLLAVMLPGMALLAATVEPAWTLLEVVAAVVERAPERAPALPRALVFAPAGLRAPPEHLL